MGQALDDKRLSLARKSSCFNIKLKSRHSLCFLQVFSLLKIIENICLSRFLILKISHHGVVVVLHCSAAGKSWKQSSSMNETNVAFKFQNLTWSVLMSSRPKQYFCNHLRVLHLI